MDIATREQRIVENADSPHLEMFLSRENREYVHAHIIRKVYDSTNGRVALSRQSDSELYYIMSSSVNPRLSLQELNKKAINDCVDIILNNVSEYLQYTQNLEHAHEQTLQMPSNTRSSKVLGQRNIY